MMALLTFFHHLPDFAVYLIIVPALTLAATLMPFAGRGLLGIRPNDDRSRGALEAYKAIIASLAFLLAFSLAQAQDTLRTLEKTVSQEAAALNTMDRSLLRYGSDEFMALRGQVRELAHLVVAEEWPALAEGGRSARAEAVVDGLSRRIRTTEAGTPRQQGLLGELLAKLDDFTDRREELITGATNTLPILFWSTIAALFGVLAVLGLFVTPTRERVLTLAGVTAAAGLVVSLVVISDAPFAGGSPVSPAPIERVRVLMEARQLVPPGG